MKKEIELQIEKLIAFLDVLIHKEDLRVYGQIKNKYVKLLTILNSKSESEKIIESDFSETISVYRLIGEAPPKDSELGKKNY